MVSRRNKGLQDLHRVLQARTIEAARTKCCHCSTHWQSTKKEHTASNSDLHTFINCFFHCLFIVSNLQKCTIQQIHHPGSQLSSSHLSWGLRKSLAADCEKRTSEVHPVLARARISEGRPYCTRCRFLHFDTKVWIWNRSHSTCLLES